MDLPRAVILRTVECDQHVPAEPTEHVKPAIDLPELLDGFGKYRMQKCWRGRVEHVADVVVGGDFGDAEQAGAVGTAMAVFELALVRQERRALHEKHREGRHADVGHGIGRVRAETLVRKSVKAAA